MSGPDPISRWLEHLPREPVTTTWPGPRTEGKGLVVCRDGAPVWCVRWNLDDSGSPHHHEVMGRYGLLELEAGSVIPMLVGADGEVLSPFGAPEATAHFVGQWSDLTEASPDEEWHFA